MNSVLQAGETVLKDGVVHVSDHFLSRKSVVFVNELLLISHVFTM